MQNDPNQPQQSPYGQPPPGWTPAEQVPPQGQAFPPYGPPPYAPPPYVPQSQPQKRSLKWLWITLIVVGAVLILSCGVCGVLAFSLSSPIRQTVGQSVGAGVTVAQYYRAVQTRNYSQAYSFLDPAATIEGQRVTQATFAQKAAQVEAQQGPISNITTNNFQFSSNLQQASAQVDLTRNHRSYTVTLELKNEGGNWKITSASGI
jgi:flagellar basal body-associated protein FliL